MTLVSVVIPAYNSSAYIGQTLASVLGQTHRPVEIIVVDDGSTDDTIAEASLYKNQGVRVLSNPKKGACAARNFGYSNSHGEFIQFLDADDILSPDKIERQLSQLLASENHLTSLIHCRWGRFYNENVNDVSWWGPHELIKRDLKPADWLIANHMSMTGCWLTPHILIEKGGLWDESLKKNQDGEFFSRLMTHADEVLYCDDVRVHYRSDIPTSISKNKSREAGASTLQSIELIESYIFSLEKSDRARLTVANMYQAFIYENFISYPDLAIIAEAKVKGLGGASVKLQGGKALKALRTLVGWKPALLIKKTLSRIIK